MSYVKVVSGTLKADSPVVNSRTGEPERMGKLVFVKGKKQTDAAEIGAGDIGAVTKLACRAARATRCARRARVVEPAAPGVPPVLTLSMAIKVKQKGDEGKITRRVAAPDGRGPDARVRRQHRDGAAGDIRSGRAASGCGVRQARKRSSAWRSSLTEPRIAYREIHPQESVRHRAAIRSRRAVTASSATCGSSSSPTDEGELVFAENVFGGSVPKNYFPAVEKGLQEAVRHGVLAGYPVVGLKATLLDGSYHPVDSSEMAFKMAAKLAYKAALPEAGPVLLEPIGNLMRYCSGRRDWATSWARSTKRRGRVLGMHPAEDGHADAGGRGAGQ